MQKIRKLYADSIMELKVTKNIGYLCFYGCTGSRTQLYHIYWSRSLYPDRFLRSAKPYRRIPIWTYYRRIFGGALDVLKYIIKPTGPFFFGFTFDAMLSGIIYGSISL